MSGLSSICGAFAWGHFHLLILVGSGGLAKSRSVRAVLDGKTCWIEGNATPFGMYVKLYRHRDQFVVIDDVDALYSDRSGVRLLKCLCQTEEEKAVAWHSDARSLERQGIPREFTTKSRVVIISKASGRSKLTREPKQIDAQLGKQTGAELSALFVKRCLVPPSGLCRPVWISRMTKPAEDRVAGVFNPAGRLSGPCDNFFN